MKVEHQIKVSTDLKIEPSTTLAVEVLIEPQINSLTDFPNLILPIFDFIYIKVIEASQFPLI